MKASCKQVPQTTSHFSFLTMSHEHQKHQKHHTFDVQLPVPTSQPAYRASTGSGGPWATLRKQYLRDAASEFLGTMLIIV